jgi:hypothetical protein
MEETAMPLIRLGLAASLVLMLTACGGGGLGGVLGPNPNPLQCDPGTQVQLANPQSGQTGVSPNSGQIIIVADGSTNTLHDNPAAWYITLTPQFGGASFMQGGALTPADGRTLTHPWASDFYYSSSIGSLTSGATWNVQLNEQNANCTPVNLGSFST